MKFISPGMSSEIVMIFQNQNLGIRTCSLAIEICRGQAADSASHNDQIVFFVKWFGRSGTFPECPIAQAVSDFKGSRMAAAEASQYRRIVRRLILCFVRFRIASMKS